MEMKTTVTVREIVEQVIKNLMDIKAPVSMIDTVIIPIRRAAGDLELVIKAWDEDEKKQKQADKENPVRLEVVPMEQPNAEEQKENEESGLNDEIQAAIDEAVALEEAKEEKANGSVHHFGGRDAD